MQHRRKLEVGDSTAALADVMDSLDIALISLDAQGRVRFANRLARSLLGANGPLHIRHGRFTCANPQAAAKLDEVLMASGQASHARLSPSIAVPYDHRRGYLTVLPFGTRGRLQPSEAKVLIALTDPNVSPKSRERTLAALFGLTPAEVRVAMLLLAGLRAKEISRHTGATHHTVRFQLKQIYRKTGTTCQSQLVRLISMLPGQLEAPRPRGRHAKLASRTIQLHVPAR